MKHAEIENIAKNEVMDFLFTEYDITFDELCEYIDENDELPDEALLWGVFDEYEYAPAALVNLMDGMRHTLVSFGSRVAGYEL